MAMHLPSNKGRGRRQPMAEINVTPLVDVMLVLLIIFMVTAPLLTAGVPVNLPESRAKPLDQDQKPVQISIDDDGRGFASDTERPWSILSRVSELGGSLDMTRQDGSGAHLTISLPAT